MIQQAEKEYLCPGERQPISRAVHLARLTAGHDACRDCPLRTDTSPLPCRVTARLEQMREAKRRPELFHAEGAGGLYLNEMDASTVRRLAMAHAKLLLAETKASTAIIAVGHDGRGESSELAAAARDGVRFFGCQVVDASATSSTELVGRILDCDATGGLLIGQDKPHTARVDIRFFGAAGKPLSASNDPTGKRLFGGSLDSVQRDFQLPVSRARRGYGGVVEKRIDQHPPTNPLLSDQPLQVVLDTPNRFLRSNIQAAWGKGRVELMQEHDPLARREVGQSMMASAVAEQRADFGACIDGHGERLEIVDEQGEPVPGDLLAALLATSLANSKRRPTIVLEPSTSKPLTELLKQNGKVRRGHDNCEGMFTRIQETEADFGGGPSGHFWLGGATPTMDAMGALERLAEILHRSCQPLSALLESIEQQAYDRSEAA